MNRIFPEQLASNLNSHLAKVYFFGWDRSPVAQ